MWTILHHALSDRAMHSTTYKYIFFKSIIDCLDLVNKELIISFDLLFERFAELYWIMILKYKLKQNNAGNTYAEQIILEFSKEHLDNKFVNFSSLNAALKNELCGKIKKKCKTYVVGALYEDMDASMYSFSKKDEWIQFNPDALIFLTRYRNVLDKINNCEWALFLQKINQDDMAATIDLLGSFGIPKGVAGFLLFQQIVVLTAQRSVLEFSATTPGNQIATYNNILSRYENIMNEDKNISIYDIVEFVEQETISRLNIQNSFKKAISMYP